MAPNGRRKFRAASHGSTNKLTDTTRVRAAVMFASVPSGRKAPAIPICVPSHVRPSVRPEGRGQNVAEGRTVTNTPAMIVTNQSKAETNILTGVRLI